MALIFKSKWLIISGMDISVPPMTNQNNTSNKISENYLSEIYDGVFICETCLLWRNCCGN